MKKRFLTPRAANVLLIFCLLLVTHAVLAQAPGIDVATSKVKEYFSALPTLLLMAGGVVALIGGFKVYNKWNSGDPDTMKTLVSWGGSAIFLVVLNPVVKAFFGI